MSIQKNPLLKETLDKCSRVFVVIAVFGLAINLLMLTSPLFMMQVFDRVITSRNTDTLMMLLLIAGLALMTMSLLEGVRTFILVRISSWIDGQIGGAALTASIMSTLTSGRDASIQALRDLNTFRAFLTGPSVFPILDAPFAPIFLGIMFLLHPLLGWISLIGAGVLLSIAIANERFTRKLLSQSSGQQMVAMKQAETASRNADVIEAMGMMPQLIKRWNSRHSESLALQAQASDRGGMLAAASKFVRVMLQIGVTGAGAWLVIKAEMSPGSMIAGSIIMGRALAPVEQAIGSWKGFLSARAAYGRLKAQLEQSAPSTAIMPLPRPKGAVSVEALSYTHINTKEPILRNINFRINPGEILGVIGPTAAGKTTLVRILVGNLKPRFGHARLDEMDVAEWSADDRGQYIGYLPQDIELFSGTIRENIARMNEGDPALVITAAKKAGIHDMVLRMEKGYETEIGEGGAALSGGQRQRIALARALYGDPSLLVLDEPNANLDSVGESALMRAMENLRAEGMTIIVIAHRPNILKHVDKILVLKDGMMQEFGPRDDVLMKLQGTQRALPRPGSHTIHASQEPVEVKKAQTNGSGATARAASPEIKLSKKYPSAYRENASGRLAKQTNGTHLNGDGKPKKRPAVLTMGPSDKIKTKIQSLTNHPLSDAEISRIYALFVKGDQQGALKEMMNVRGPIIVGLVIIFLFFGAFIGWAAFAPLGSAAIAQGIVSVEGNRKSVQHLEGGIVAEIKVKDGDFVKKGDVLIVLDEIQSKASMEIIRGRRAVALAQKARLTAERDGLDKIVFDEWLVKHKDEPNIREAMQGQQNIFESRRTSREGQTTILEQKAAQLEEEIKGLEGQVAASDRQISLISDEIKDVAGLVEKNLAGRPRLRALQRSLAELSGNRSQNISKIAQTRQAIGEVQLQINEQKNSLMDEVVSGLRDVQSQLFDLEEQTRASEDVLDRTDIRAPTDGYVVNLQVHTAGGVIAPGATVLDIVPDNVQLIVEAKVNTKDIDSVYIGAPARIRFPAFSQRFSLPAEGTVVSVSADSLQDERSGTFYYLARVKIDKLEDSMIKITQLRPGMQADVMISTGERTALDYFVNPIILSFNRALRED